MGFDNTMAKEVAASMIAATAVPLTLNWTDFTKTRMQGAMAPGCTALPYTGGFSNTVKRMVAEEGIFKVWGTGIGASIMRECTVFGIRIGAYPSIRDKLSSLIGGRTGGDAGVGSKLFTGAVLGAFSGLASTPFDLARIRVQAEAGRVDSSGILTTGLRAGLSQHVRNTPQAFRVFMLEGAFGLFRGSSVNIMRSICSTVGTMPVYEHTKHVAKSQLGVEDSPSLHFGAGIVAGLVGTTVSAPADVLRTRIMQSGKDGGGMSAAVSGIMRDYGLRGFFRGWLPAYMRLGPLFLFMPALTEQVRKLVFGLSYIV